MLGDWPVLLLDLIIGSFEKMPFFFYTDFYLVTLFSKALNCSSLMVEELSDCCENVESFTLTGLVVLCWIGFCC